MRALLVVLLAAAPAAAEGRPVGLESFLRRAAAADTEFQTILVERLALAYRENLRLPARDITLAVTEQLELDLDGGNDEGADTSVSLSKLFPLSGTEVDLDYDVNPSATTSRASSAFSAKVTQPVAKNAFGRSTRWLKSIVGLEVEVAEHQITEAYEDYFARLVGFYLDWWEAAENLKIARSSYESNKKLLDNMLARQRSKIALPIDVNKIKLQVMAREERLVRFEEEYKTATNLVESAMRWTDAGEPEPAEPAGFLRAAAEFAPALNAFLAGSRTMRVVRRLEEKAGLEASRAANDLLPSIDLFAGVERSGKGPGLDSPANKALGGVTLSWPLGHQTDRAERAIAEVAKSKAALEVENTRVRLRTALENLDLRLARERRLRDLAEDKTGVAAAVLKDETENYTIGKATLNEYITAVNSLDSQRFDRVAREVEWRKLNVEWLRLTDTLVRDSPGVPVISYSPVDNSK